MYKRQVTGILRAKDAVTDTPSEHIMMSLTLYLLLYGFLLIAYIRTLFVMANRAVLLEQSANDTDNDDENNMKQNTKPNTKNNSIDNEGVSA